MNEYPVLRLRPKAAPRLKFGAPWAYTDEVVWDRRTRKLPAGSMVVVEDADRVPRAVATVNPNSKIAVRVMDHDPNAVITKDWIATRISTALAHRARLYPDPFYRLIHAEADGLPGVIIDRFDQIAVIQPNAAWADHWYDDIAQAVMDQTGISTLVKNGSGRSRLLEGLPELTEVTHGSITDPIHVPMNGAVYMADVLGGQKTGLFFDQRENHASAARLANGFSVLDVFSHVGGFALAALAGGACSALAVDGSAPALDLARQGAEAAGMADRFETRQGDAFEVMTQLGETAHSYDLVICDPPAFAPAKPALEAGLRAYERVARLAAPLVAEGGYLILCSCSHAADLDRFRQACLRGVGRAGRRAQIIHTGAAGPDHPTHAHLAESSYLKAVFLRLIP